MIDYSNYKGFKDRGKDTSVLTTDRDVLKTHSLFRETIPLHIMKRGEMPLYSLKDHETDGFPSAYQIYMHSVDEYDAALKLVGSLKHWRRLSSSAWFLKGYKNKGFEGLKQWREDMLARDLSLAKEELIRATKKGDSSSARKLIEMSKIRKGPGRPKEDKPEESEDTDENESLINELHSEIS